MPKVIITAALTGSFPTRELTPYLPVTPQEIAEEAYRCHNSGAAIVHIHARAPDGKPTSDSQTYAEIDRLIHERCNVVINHTTSGGRGAFSSAERLKSLEDCPYVEAASFNMGHTQKFPRSLEDLSAASGMLNTISDMVTFAREMRKRGIKPECEIYDVSMINTVKFLCEHDLLELPAMVQFVMGLGGQCIDGTPKNLLHLVETLTLTGLNAHWSVCAAGRFEFPMITMGLLLGGNIRVGLEDNLYLKKGVLAKSNAELVEKAVRVVNEQDEREIATPDEARDILRVQKRRQQGQ